MFSLNQMNFGLWLLRLCQRWGKGTNHFSRCAALNGRGWATRGGGGVGYGDDNRRFANASDMTLTSISHLKMITIWLYFSHGEI